MPVNIKEKTMRKIILTSLVLTVLLQTPFFSYGDEPDASAKTRTLLHQLAMVENFLPPEKDKTDHDILNCSGHSSNYIFVRPLLREIYLEGKNALPALADFFDNENYLYHYSGYSMMSGEIMNMYVYLEAENIFCEIINPVAYDLCYAPKFVTRIGADGLEHRKPQFNTFSITETRESAQQWLRQNADKSLADIQREIVDFYIREEIKIGFPDEESYQQYLVPLLNLRDNLPYVNENFHNVIVDVPYSPTPHVGSNPAPKNRPVRVIIPRDPSKY